MVQPITDYAAFFSGAKQIVEELGQLKERQRALEEEEKVLENSLAQKKKALADNISQTVKQRTEEIIKSYDAENDKAEERLKKVKAKREKAKNQGVKERITEKNQGLVHENADLKRQMKTLFHTNRVPGFCASGYYYAMYFTRGFKEILTLLTTLLICFVAIPCGVYFLLPERKTIYLFGIYIAVIAVFGGLYVGIGNVTRGKHLEVLKAGRNIRNQINTNNRKMKAVAKEVQKDKNESVYNLQKFDDEISQLDQEILQITAKKKEALNTFETVTKTIISDEITGNYKPEIDEIESKLAGTLTELTNTRNTSKEKALTLTDQYAIYVGKEFMTTERLDALEEIIAGGLAANVSEAVEVYNRGDYKKPQTEQSPQDGQLPQTDQTAQAEQSLNKGSNDL